MVVSDTKEGDQMKLSSEQLSAELKEKGISVSNCMLEQTMGTVVGVAAGLAIGLRTKSVKPLILTSFLGSTADLGYGYYNACDAPIVEFLVLKRMRDEENRLKDENKAD
jgi:hypothetical protein